MDKIWFSYNEIERLAKEAKMESLEIVGLMFLMNRIIDDRQAAKDKAAEEQRLYDYHEARGDYVG